MSISLDTRSGDRATQELEQAAAHGSGAWRRLGLRLSSVTPRQLARFLLVVAAVAGELRAGSHRLPPWVMIARGIPADRIADLARQESGALGAIPSATAEPYGVEIRQVVITLARPSDGFVRAREGERLASVQRAEQAERQTLELQRQADQDALARQQLTARLDRERQELESQLTQAEMRRRVAAADVEAETVRLGKLDAGLRAYPLAASWETQGARLEVSRALAGNTRAVVQTGPMEDIAGALVSRERSSTTGQPPSQA
ncbi:MAG: hypothetical protein JO023_25300 [Chloroflexi bacterium]|nr:hypothetical protein [Chloroflexota bacterium]